MDWGHSPKWSSKTREGQWVVLAQDHSNQHFLHHPNKDALTILLITYTFNDRRRTRHGLIECDITSLHDSISFKVKYMISIGVRSIT